MEDQIDQIMMYNSKEHDALEKYLHAMKKGIKKSLKRAQKDPLQSQKMKDNIMLVVKSKGENPYKLNIIKEEANKNENSFRIITPKPP